jgi:hypothetical protein
MIIKIKAEISEKKKKGKHWNIKISSRTLRYPEPPPGPS